MLNPQLDFLPGHNFAQLRALLADVQPAANHPVFDLTIGEPRHAMPDFIADVLAENVALYGKYPANFGTENWQASVSGWLQRRFGITDMKDESRFLPLSGTREGLFSVAFACVPPHKNGKQPLVLMPNPFYQCYAAAALAAGAKPVYVAANRDNNFLPDIAGLPEGMLAQTALVYLCSPANPQGAVASDAYLKHLICLARQHDFTLVMDECYIEIYTGTPPKSALQICAYMQDGNDDPYRNVLAFHSLSKRSNLPGLRSGFVAGDEKLIAAYRQLRAYGGAPPALPVQAASAAAWKDDAHVVSNRALYQDKFRTASDILDGVLDFYVPEGGFYLWLNVGDGEAATRRLWQQAAVRVLPGAYLARADETGYNPGAAYIRVALVDKPEFTGDALQLIRQTLAP